MESLGFEPTMLEALLARQRAVRRLQLPGVAIATGVRLLSRMELRQCRLAALQAIGEAGLGESAEAIREEIADHCLALAWVQTREDGQAGKPVAGDVQAFRKVDEEIVKLIAREYDLHEQESSLRGLDDAAFEEVFEEVKKKPELARSLSDGSLLRRLCVGLAVALMSSATSSSSSSVRDETRTTSSSGTTA